MYSTRNAVCSLDRLGALVLTVRHGFLHRVLVVATPHTTHSMHGECARSRMKQLVESVIYVLHTDWAHAGAAWYW